MSSLEPSGDNASGSKKSGKASRPDATRGLSWIERMHKKHHDKKHGRSTDESEAAPLLAEVTQDEEDEDVEAQDEPEQESRVRRVQNQAQNAYDTAIKGTKRMFDASYDYVSQNWKYAIIALICAGLTILAGILLSVFLKRKPASVPVSTCTSAACVHAASEILYNLDPKYSEIDPCTDFDRYVCGGFDERHDLRPDQGDMFTGNLMAEASQMILRHILESDPDSDSTADRENFEKLQAAYDACMDESQIREKGLQPMKDILQDIIDIFPTLSYHSRKMIPFPEVAVKEQHNLVSQSQKQLADALRYLMDLGVPALLDFGVGPDDRNPDSVIISVGPPSAIGLPSKEYYKNPKTVSEYRAVASSVMSNILGSDFGNASSTWHRGPSIPRTKIVNLVNGFVDLEIRLAAITPAEEDQEDVTKTYNPRTIKEIRALLPQVSVESLISSQAPSGFNPDFLLVTSPDFLTGLADILSSTPNEVIQNFLLWKAVQGYADKVEDPAVEPLRRFENTLRGKEPDAKEDRWRTCINYVDGGLGWILSEFFVKAAFSEDSKKFGDRIVSDIKDSFVDTLSTADWMTETVQNLGIEKVHNIVQKIGYPTASPDILDPEALKDFYSPLTISKTAFFDNSVQIAKFDRVREWNRLGKPTNRDEWYMTTPTVNAYYSPPGNEIVFPAGIMQSPVFYHPSVPQYLSYGAFGAVSGHELSHAFDSTGRHYDQTGNYTDWWDTSTVKAFEEKAQCFVDQYSNFSVMGPEGDALPVNGRLTLGENIADAGGLRASFMAWKRREEETPTQVLPGLEKFSKEQLFFISYSNWWCGKTTSAKAVERVYSDPHAPKRARILGTMANSREFREAFQCPNKEPTCKLW